MKSVVQLPLGTLDSLHQPVVNVGSIVGNLLAKQVSATAQVRREARAKGHEIALDLPPLRLSGLEQLSGPESPSLHMVLYFAQHGRKALCGARRPFSIFVARACPHPVASVNRASRGVQGDRVLESSIISISAERDWYPVTPGPDGAIIPLTAWSSAPFGPWFVSATASSFSVRVDDVGAPPTPTIVGDDFLPGVENGDPLNLLVTAKPGTPSGTWEVVYARSSPLAAHRGADLAHVWPVGIYVP